MNRYKHNKTPGNVFFVCEASMKKENSDVRQHIRYEKVKIIFGCVQKKDALHKIKTLSSNFASNVNFRVYTLRYLKSVNIDVDDKNNWI